MDTSTVIVVALIVVAIIAIPVIVISRFASSSRRRIARSMTAEAEEAVVRPKSLGDRLATTRAALGGRLGLLKGRHELDEVFWSEFEDMLVSADVGVEMASELTGRVRTSDPLDAEAASHKLRQELVSTFGEKERHLAHLGTDPVAMVVVGVNGSGKTTTIAKLAQRYQELGASAILGAADTFRAGAAEQLRVWAGSVGVDVIDGEVGADPASVAHDALDAAKARGTDVVIIDTAGRLHSDTNLMEELTKVVRIVDREAGGVDEVLLVLDGTGGQNSIAQAKMFSEAVGVTGIIVTKLDGTAKGGMAVAVESQLGIPIKLIGVGESADDLIPFIPEQFVDALLEDPDGR
ncbi:MAG: signal recognition particle-docking protein FtsY [Acidimicrobiia bacterium]